MKQALYKSVSGTLDYGKRISVAMIVFCFVMVVMGIGTCVAFTVATVIENEPPLIIAAVLFPLYFWSLSGYVLIREYKHLKVIKLWCEDAVELTAVTVKKYCADAQKLILHYGKPDEQNLQQNSQFIQLFNNKYKHYPLFILKVKLSYKGENHVFYSLKRQRSEFDTLFLRGYSYHSEIVDRYGDCKVNVLYSPKYNKVMFLKNSKVRPFFTDDGDETEEFFETFDKSEDIE